MKLSKLFEDVDEVKYLLRQMAYKYPMIDCIHLNSAFITDLPKDIQLPQLQQLCKISFSDQVYTHLYDNHHRYGRPTIRVIDQPILINNEIINYVVQYDHYANIDDMCCNWKQYCNRINDAIGTYDNDFED